MIFRVLCFEPRWRSKSKMGCRAAGGAGSTRQAHSQFTNLLPPDMSSKQRGTLKCGTRSMDTSATIHGLTLVQAGAGLYKLSRGSSRDGRAYTGGVDALGTIEPGPCIEYALPFVSQRSW